MYRQASGSINRAAVRRNRYRRNTQISTITLPKGKVILHYKRTCKSCRQIRKKEDFYQIDDNGKITKLKELPNEKLPKKNLPDRRFIIIKKAGNTFYYNLSPSRLTKVSKSVFEQRISRAKSRSRSSSRRRSRSRSRRSRSR